MEIKAENCKNFSGLEITRLGDPERSYLCAQIRCSDSHRCHMLVKEDEDIVLPVKFEPIKEEK